MEPVAYYIIHLAKREGPFTQEQLHELIATRQITVEHAGWRAGMAEWRPLSEFLPPPVPRAAPPPLPVPSVPAPAQPPSQKNSKTWIWVTTVALVVLSGVVALVGIAVHTYLKRGTPETAFLPMREERSGHEIQWQKSALKPSGPPVQPEDKIFQLVRYKAPVGELAAYLTPDPKDNKKHPAIVWAHSFSNGIGSSFWQLNEDGYNLTARAFREKGIVMMCPSWRGENGNPGRRELLFGEVDDFLAAIEHIKTLPYVDPQQIYIGGHNTGGTLTLLAACATDQFRAAFSVGGMLDGAVTLKTAKPEEIPFNSGSERDLQLRNPMRYAAFIQKPVFYFEADVFFDKNAVKQMQSRAGPHFQAFHLAGTHFDILHPVTQLIAEKIAAGAELQFTNEELTKSYRLADYNDQRALLAGTGDDDHGLSAILAKNAPDKPDAPAAENGKGPEKEDLGLPPILAKENLLPGNGGSLTLGELKVIQNALIVFCEKKDCSAQTLQTVARLANLKNRIIDSQVFQEFDVLLAGKLADLAQMRLSQPSALTHQEEQDIFNIIGAVIRTQHASVADLTAAALYRGVLIDSKIEWLNLLHAFDEHHSQTGRFMKAFSGSPPSGKAGEILLHHISSRQARGTGGPNPYNSGAGSKVLKTWLTSKDPAEYVNAGLAARAAAFLDADIRSELIELALAHPDKQVRVQAAWADAKSGGSRGIPLLKQACLDVELSAGAQACLKSLLREDQIPQEAASDPGMIAKSFIIQMLKAPTELGEAPLSIEIYDHKNIVWPTMKEKYDIWLLKFTFQPKGGGEIKTGYGFHSKYTSWCSTKNRIAPKVPEDLYIYTCAMDLLRSANNSGKPMTRKEAEAEALMALRANNPGVFDSVKLTSQP